MLNREELNVLIEREGIKEFFNVIDCFFNKTTNCTIYELETDYYAVMFRIFPPAYSGDATEKVVASSLTCGLPDDTIVQFHQISSKNLSDHENNYKETILHDINKINIDNPSMLQDLHDGQLEFLNKHVDNTVFEKTKLPFYLRDFVNTATVLFPMKNKNKSNVKIEDLEPVINKFKAALYTMYPQNINEHHYIRIMRELINPYNPIPNMYRDPNMDIRDHFTDNDSVLEDIGKGTIKLCRSRDINFESQERAESKTKITFFQKILKFFGLFDEEEETVSDNNSKTNSKYYVKVLSKKSFPERADLFSITNLSMDYLDEDVHQRIPLPYVITTTVKIENPLKAIDSARSAAITNKHQLENPFVAKIAHFFPEYRKRADEATNVIEIFSSSEGREIPMKTSWSMLLYSQDPHLLEYNCEIIKTKYQDKGFILQEEDLISILVFLYAMPMKYDEFYRKDSMRFQTIFKTNTASIAPLGTDSRGFGENAVIQFFGRNGQVQSFDLFDKSAPNKNAVIVGPTGRGKSFLIQRIIWSYLKQDSKIRIIDSGDSYKELCSVLGGQYISFKEKNNICINPFSGARTNNEGKLLEDEVSNITSAIGLMAGFDLNESGSNMQTEMANIITSYISSAVVNAFEVKGNSAGMNEVGNSLRNQLSQIKENARVEGDIRDGDVDRKLPGLITALAEFTEPSGMYYSYVNGESNVSFSKNLVILDIEELNTKQRKFRDFVISTFTNIVEREFYIERNDNKKKIFIIDEAWSLLNGKAGSAILGLYRKSRKLRGSIITITQSIEDYYQNANIKGIYDNAYWRLFLEQDSATIQTAIDENKIVMDPFAFRLLQTVKYVNNEYSEVMVMTQSGGLMIGRILATKIEFWLSTQDYDSVDYINKIMNDFKIEEAKARLMIGYSLMRETSVEEELIRLNGYFDKATDELIKEKSA